MASKTVIQGLNNNSPIANPMSGMPGNDPYSNPYSRSSASSNGTVVPGMARSNVATTPVGQPPFTNSQETPVVQPHDEHKPIYGFLYSISKTMAAEYWPLYLGLNTIGTDPLCNVVLAEGTVSCQHAKLVVRKMNTGGIIASITDASSTNGTMLNGESLDFDPHRCKNGDIITIGNNYQLYLILLDPGELGLSVSKDFIRIEEDAPIDNFPPFCGSNPYERQSGEFAGTVGIDGSINTQGGTIGM